MSEERASGRTPTVADEEILAVFEATRDPVLTTVEVAADLPIGRRATLERLKQLRDGGRLESKTVGPRGQVWWLADTERTANPALVDDPFLTAPTYASGRSDVSGDVDDALADAIEAEVDSEP